MNVSQSGPEVFRFARKVCIVGEVVVWVATAVLQRMHGAPLKSARHDAQQLANGFTEHFAPSFEPLGGETVKAAKPEPRQRSREQDLLDQLTNPYDARAMTVLDAYLRGIAYSDGRTSALPRWKATNDNGL